MTLAWLNTSQDQQTILVHYFRKWTQQDPFNPTEDCCIGSDSEGETQDNQDRKAGAAPQHSETEMYIPCSIVGEHFVPPGPMDSLPSRRNRNFFAKDSVHICIHRSKL